MIKSAARAKYLKDRKALSNKVRNQYSKQIADQLMHYFSLEGKTVSVFMNIQSFAEVNTSFYFNAGAKQLVLPVVQDEGELKHFIYESEEQIRISDWGIPEPTYGEQLEEGKIDLVIVPMVIADKRGYRVGYGKGFYDNFLKKCRKDCQFVGVCFYDPIEEIEDVHENDIRLHACVTPSAVHSFD